MQSPAIIYLKTRLYRDFGENSAVIIRSFDEELATRFSSSQVIRENMENQEQISTDTQTESLDAFQFILDQLIYPFMACSEAMMRSGMEDEMVKRYVLRLWEELPEKMLNSIIERATAGKVHDRINAYLAGVRSALVVPLFDK